MAVFNEYLPLSNKLFPFFYFKNFHSYKSRWRKIKSTALEDNAYKKTIDV